MNPQLKKQIFDVLKAAVAAATVAFVSALIHGLNLQTLINPTAAMSLIAGFFALKFRT